MINFIKKNICKWISIIVIILIFAQKSIAQNNQVSECKNSVKISIPKTEIGANSEINANNSLSRIQYTDGLGRKNIVILKGFTPQGKDLASITNYDCFGNVSNQWLPTPALLSSVPDPNQIMQQSVNYYGDDKPFSKYIRSTDLQNQDPNNVGQFVKVLLPGEELQNNNKGTIVSSVFHLSQNKVRAYGVNANNLVLYDDILELYINKVIQTIDEEGKVSYSFYDAWDKIILNRKIADGQNYDTYFVYDDIGNLRFVLSPEASDKLTVPGVYTLGTEINGNNDPLAQFSFIYNYDAKRRCISKKLPGKDWIYMMYDKADHLIFSQDGNQRANNNEWTYYKYDVYDRIIQSGKTYGLSGSIQAVYNDNPAVENYVAGTGYTNNCPLGSNSVLLIQNFYDSYDFVNLPAYSSIKSHLIYNNLNGYDVKYANLIDGIDIGVKGMLTGTAVALLDNSTVLVNAYYYDHNGNIVQKRANNHLGGYDYDFLKYNFNGLPVQKLHVHKTPFVTSDINEKYKFLYDNANRLISLRHTINTQKEVLMDSFVYDETGRVSKKIIHGGIQTLNYTYNIRNQIKTINSQKFSETLYYDDSPFGNSCYDGKISAVRFGTGNDKVYKFEYDDLHRLLSATNNDELFTEEVGAYDKNGNILSIKRKGYVYDDYHNINHGFIDDLSLTYNGNQLKSINDDAIQSNVITTNDFLDKRDNNYLTEYLYDKNGNQYADLNKGIAWIKYNLLNLPEKIQFRNGTKNEYIYDASGIKRRANYNYSTNTTLIPLGQTSSGNNAASTYRLDYCDNYVYEKSGGLNPKLKRIITPEGFIQTYQGLLTYLGYWKYLYNLKDHQGNTRFVLSSDYISNSNSTNYTSTEQIDYYPFGLERSNTGQTSGGALNSGTNPYLYSGNEIERLNGLNQHDFHARWLDNAVPGFTTPDPLAERNWAESPYVYCGSDPVNRIDPLGLDWYWNKAGNETPVWFEGSKDVPGFDTHSPSCWLYSQNFRYFFAENGNIYVYPLEGGDLYHSFERNQESLYNAYGFVPPRHDEDEDSDGGEEGNSGTNDVLNNINTYTNIAGINTDIIKESWRLIGKKNQQSLAYAVQQTSKLHGGNIKPTLFKPGVTKGLKIAGKVAVVSNYIVTGAQVYNDAFNEGEYYSAGARVAVLGFATGAAFVPVFGWGITILVTGLEIAYGEQFYEFVENKLGN